MYPIYAVKVYDHKWVAETVTGAQKIYLTYVPTTAGNKNLATPLAVSLYRGGVMRCFTAIPLK